MLAKASLLAMNDKEVDEATKKAKVIAVLLRFHDLLHALPPGGTLILPGGGSHPRGGMASCTASCITPDGSYSFTVSNTGGGLPYHPAQTGTPKSRFLCTLRFDGISRAKMLDDGFWLMFWRLQLVSSDDHDHHTIYDVLIPHLTGGTVAETLSTQDDACEYRTPQRAGNCYYRVCPLTLPAQEPSPLHPSPTRLTYTLPVLCDPVIVCLGVSPIPPPSTRVEPWAGEAASVLSASRVRGDGVGGPHLPVLLPLQVPPRHPPPRPQRPSHAPARHPPALLRRHQRKRQGTTHRR